MLVKAEALDKYSDGTLCLPLPRLAESSASTPETTLSIFTDDAVYESCGTRIAFTTRAGGMSAPPYAALNLSYAVGDEEAAVDANRRLLCEALGARDCADRLVWPQQVHGVDVLEVNDAQTAQVRAQEGVDGVVCVQPDVPVLLCFADCVPVILVAPGGAFAVLHAGWRGALGGIPEIGLEKLAKATSCQISDINCYIGPHIGKCCYEVGSGILKQFVAKYGMDCDAGENHLDLSGAVIASLRRVGASSERIVDVQICTSCSTDRFFSHRAENGLTGRHGAFALRKE